MDDSARTSEEDAALSRLVGLPWTGLGRAADLVWCLFGSNVRWRNHRGEVTEKSEFSLHLQTPFRITLGNRLILGSIDLYEPTVDKDQEPFSSKLDYTTLFDFKAAQLSADLGLSVVVKAKANSLGDVTIDLESGLRLEAFTLSSTRSEAWRLIGFADPELNFVFPQDFVTP